MTRPKRNSLWQISIHCQEQAGDAVADLLTRILRQTAITSVDEETRRTQVSVYLPYASPLTPQTRTELRQALRALKAYGLGSTRLTIAEIRVEDWANSWKRHFRATLVGSLLLKPSWSRRKPRPGQAMIVLDPGLAFGTGQHPTTGYCLRQVVATSKRIQNPSLLDIGTGSGILAIAAAKLGYRQVEAFDFDPACVKVAKANAQLNRVSSRLKLARRDLTRLPAGSRQQFDLICANLIYDLLVAERDRILARLKPTGRLVVAGILIRQFPKVRRAFAERGLVLLDQRRENEWQSGMFGFR